MFTHSQKGEYSYSHSVRAESQNSVIQINVNAVVKECHTPHMNYLRLILSKDLPMLGVNSISMRKATVLYVTELISVGPHKLSSIHLEMVHV